LRCHEGNEGYEYGNHPHENEGTPQLLAAEVSMGKLATTLIDRQTNRKTVTDRQRNARPNSEEADRQQRNAQHGTHAFRWTGSGNVQRILPEWKL